MRKIKKTTYTVIVLLFVISFVAPIFSQAQVSSPVYFFVDPNYKIDSHQQEEILFLHSSQRAYFYVEKKYYDNLSSEAQAQVSAALQDFGNTFDTKIYDRVRNIFGSEWNPGVDNDSKITIYFTDMPTKYNGYFREIDENTSPFAVNSNKREMIYINANYATSYQLPAIVTHEFQHLAHYNQKRKQYNLVQEKWINEGLSEYAVTVAGYEESGDYLNERVRAFKSSPNTSLILWNDSIENYATASLFMHYLADVYGQELIYGISHNGYVGIESINRALAALNISKDFSQVYSDWTASLFLNQNFDNTQIYAYKNSLLNFLNLRVNARSTLTISDTNLIKTSVALQDFSPQWYRFIPANYDLQNPKFLNIKFESLDKLDIFKVAVIITTLAGDITVDTHTVTNGMSLLDIPNFNQNISSVVVIPASHTKLIGFDNSENKFRVLSIEASLKDSGYSLKDGDLVKTIGDNKVYVVKGNTKRWIPSPKIFNGYGHLKWENIIEVSEGILNTYAESRLIKFAQDYRVYQVSSDGKIKQWLNMSPTQFISSGRDWGQIYEINQNEFGRYLSGPQIAT
ncbi:MAG: hypothetical protein A3H51_00245 [Candidatus Spechtbacteria bacterium RIFCSPLOWO2_02_FULL_38_8]|uniref:DUF2268 domain-containing protein n=1 Tax=Candidatus Spechtbacteria bacterium RIFCSPLOWO2_02_FULL_38_8 TaxID=1802164 RepID=A0A1G2HHF6_9BACT|nr:MAG: hypothetical protein A3H51_00245 [Candidatus Spechtbacteria bacterium RIFCSPLOWO2_02_FULL_38_8]